MTKQDEINRGFETQLVNVRERLGKIDGRLDSSSSNSPNWVFITILSILGAAVVAYLSWIGTEVVNQGKKLTAIETKLTVLGLENQASLPQPAFDKALPETRSVIAVARKDGISVPPAVIEGLRSKLLASNSKAPDFWPTLSEFVSYRSSLSYQAGSAPAPPIGMYYFARLPDCTDSLPKPMTIKEVLGPHEVIPNRGLYENCRFVLDSAKQAQILNAILKGSTPLLTFKSCLIEYHGGEINLILAWDKEPFTMTTVGSGPEDPTKVSHTALSGPAVQFENCLFSLTFQNSPPPNGQRLSKILLAENTDSVSLPVSP